jgi:type IV pilus assembly protein PilB
MVSSEDVLIILSEVLSFPPIRLSQYNIDMEILKLIPRKISYSYLVLPISRIGKQLTVAMVDPLNIFALDDLRIMTNLEISPVLVTKDDIMEALASYYEKDSHDELSELVEDMRDGKMEMVSEEESTVSSMELLRITEEAPVVKMTNMIMARAVKERASDIMIEPMEDRIRVRYRVDGVLHESFEPPKKFHQAIISRIKVMSDLDIAERRLPQDGRFRIKLEGRKVDFRVAIVPSSFGEKCALRILDKEQARTDLNALGFKERSIEKIQKAAKKPHGMLLVCGPTGCGKTTTLYSILKYVEDPELNLITVEDPVEFELKGINQVQVNEELGLTFAGCLRSILRQDPDIIMVGEIRDFTTLDVAIKSALTGHLVLSTLHTNTSAESIVRMINMGIEPFLICSSIELIAAQRLLRKLCSDCKELYAPAPDIAEQYGLFDDNGDIKKIYKPRGCPRCGNTGYKGRVGIVECLELTDPIKDLIFKDAQASEIEVEARKEGMKTLRENGIENVLEGLTSLEDVLRMTIAPKETV